MKHIILITLFLIVAISHLSAQIKTRDSREDISINDIKFGYIYSIDQFKKALGEPTNISVCGGTDYGNSYQLVFGDDLTVRFNDDVRDLYPGIICFIRKGSPIPVLSHSEGAGIIWGCSPVSICASRSP